MADTFCEIETFYQFLGQQIEGTSMDLSPEECVQAFRAYQCDLDRLKEINDTYGHQLGDVVLNKVAQGLSNGVRVYDAVGRYGGEEFLIVAPGCDRSTAQSLSARLHALIQPRLRHGPDPVGDFLNERDLIGRPHARRAAVNAERADGNAA